MLLVGDRYAATRAELGGTGGFESSVTEKLLLLPSHQQEIWIVALRAFVPQGSHRLLFVVVTPLTIFN